MCKFVFLLLVIVSWYAFGATPLNICTPVPVEYLPHSDFFARLNEHVKKFGFTPTFQFLPRLRGLTEVNNGNMDGDFAVTAKKAQQFENIIMVKGPVTSLKVVGFFLTGNDISIKGMDDLKKYKVGYIKGWDEIEKIAAQGKTYAGVTKWPNLVKMLLAARFDVILMEQSVGKFTMGTLNVPEDKYSSSTVLMELPVYFLLNKKHQTLRDNLEKAMAITR